MPAKEKIRLKVDVLPEEIEGWSDEEIARLHDAALGMLEFTNAQHRLRETAHLHETVHELKRKPARFGKDGGMLEEEAALSDSLVCHDCGRQLVNDAGSEPLLVCPKLHGMKLGLKPGKPLGALECGQPGS